MRFSSKNGKKFSTNGVENGENFVPLQRNSQRVALFMHYRHTNIFRSQFTSHTKNKMEFFHQWGQENSD